MEVLQVVAAAAALVCGGGLIFGVVKRVNEWVYVSSLGRQRAALLPPGDMGWPLVGQMWAFFRAFKFGRPDSFLARFISRFGRTGIYKTFIFGSPSIIVCTPETCKRVLTDDQHFIPGYPKATSKLMGNRSFHGISPAEHKRLRRLTAAPINGLEALTLFVSKIEDILGPSMEKWAESGQPVALMTEMNKVTLTYMVITNILFGANVDYDIQKMESIFYDLAHGKD
ncbi:ent-kaurenoic acid oxidase-like [Eucalyptus grandis]|uniref:ent-kaurenoic acid oxidase-like n=1 Tax=Eucalyptus grandis TaxID=71139 RepID=UPI00192E9FA2|nr:ent-kaurenoic acid oxidase-like [Eucalyptus grandis]